ncbi:hypothetical protein FOXYSP1_12830 [Fusarium oxysporum f. sp. phaseoli]
MPMRPLNILPVTHTLHLPLPCHSSSFFPSPESFSH